MPRPRPATPQREDERVNTGIRFPVPLIRRARREADRRGVSLNRLVCWAVEDWLDGRSSADRR